MLLENLYKINDELHNDLHLTKDCTANEDLCQSINQVQMKIKELEEEKAVSAMFRSRQQWHELGEKNSAYFFALEKRNYVSKIMFSCEL